MVLHAPGDLADDIGVPGDPDSRRSGSRKEEFRGDATDEHELRQDGLERPGDAFQERPV
jgi:hypothetical protein